jgi:hypothetical protein
MDIAHISTAAELLSLDHPHFGRIQSQGFLKTRIGILTSTNRKAIALEDYSSGKRQIVALDIDPGDFMVTIASSFVLVTMKEGASRPPVILKNWKKVGPYKGSGDTKFSGTVNTYMDSDGLKWKHRFNRSPDQDELIGFGSKGTKILVITLENLR